MLRRPPPYTLLLSTALALAGAWVNLTFGFSRGDEAWFLQVVRRHIGGEDIYEDVFLGTTPLSAYVTGLAARFAGVEAVVLRSLVLICFVLSGLLVVRVAGQLGASRLSGTIAAAGVLVYGRPQVGSLYTPLAIVFFLCSFTAILSWRNSEGARERRQWLLLGGAAAGLCIMTKQNIGLLVTMAAGATLLLGQRDASRRDTLRAIALLAGAVAVPVVLISLPVVISGGLDELIDFGFLGKGNYLRYGSVPFLDGIKEFVKGVAPPWSATGLIQASKHVIYLLPLAALGALPFFRRSTDLASAGCFTIAGCLSAFPRFNLTEMLYVAPTLLPAIAGASSRVGARLPNRVRLSSAAMVAVVLAGGVAFLLVRPALDLRHDEWVSSNLTHFRHILVTTSEHEEAENDSARLAQGAAGRPLLLAHHEAGFLYLSSGIRNPTPFDFPLVTAFGASGEKDVAEQIRSGHLGRACVGEFLSLAPRDLLSAIEKELSAGRWLGPCRLWERPGDEVGGATHRSTTPSNLESS